MAGSTREERRTEGQDVSSGGVYTTSSLSPTPVEESNTARDTRNLYRDELNLAQQEFKYNTQLSRLSVKQAEAEADAAQKVAAAKALAASYADTNNSGGTSANSSTPSESSTTSSSTTEDPLAYKPPTLSALQGTGFQVKDASAYNTPETSVAYQLSQLLASDNPYMKQVDAKSKLTANSLGMLSSDRFIGAAMGAAIREGLPIATADAATAAKFGLQQQQADNNLANVSLEGLVSGNLQAQKGELDVRLANVQGEISKSLANLNNAANLELAGANNAAAMERLNVTNAANLALQELNNQFQASLQSDLLASNLKRDTLAAASSQINNSTISIENMLKDPDILQLGSEAVTNLVGNQIDLMKAGIKTTYGLAGLDIDSYVDGVISNYTDTFNYQTGTPDEGFDDVAYMKAKVAQLNSIGYEGRTNWTAAEAVTAMKAAGMTPEEHYNTIGKYEGITV